MNGRSPRDTEGIALLACGSAEVPGEVVIQYMINTNNEAERGASCSTSAIGMEDGRYLAVT